MVEDQQFILSVNSYAFSVAPTPSLSFSVMSRRSFLWVMPLFSPWKRKDLNLWNSIILWKQGNRMKSDSEYNRFIPRALRYVGKTVLVLSFPDLIFFLPILSPSGQRVTVLVRAEIKPPSLLDLRETNRPPIHVESQIFLGFNMVRERCWASPFNFLMNWLPVPGIKDSCCLSLLF